MFRRRELRAIVVLVGIAASAVFGYLAVRGVKFGATWRGLEAEITARLRRRGARIYEMPMPTGRALGRRERSSRTDGLCVIATLARCRVP
jgi:hypothetical protein